MREEIPGLQELLEYFKSEGVHTCILYGSAAAGRRRSDSDIDLAIAADSEFSPETLTRHYLKATSLLKSEVDLRDLRRAKGLYLKEVLTKGKILLSGDPQFLGNKAIEMMDYQTDLAPQVNAIRREQLERSLYEK
ncbi:MAG TPA: nucleotidyltransferase domain-containing protein [Clostridia bacterium]|nr:nucleotidyltransferase domain-containing protein [Clostridia bacterium]